MYTGPFRGLSAADLERNGFCGNATTPNNPRRENCMSAGLDNLKHIVVLMMENRSFDHMLGSLKADDSRINGITGNEFNMDTQNETAKVAPLAEFQSQLDPDPNHHFPAVHNQLYEGTNGPPDRPSM